MYDKCNSLFYFLKFVWDVAKAIVLDAGNHCRLFEKNGIPGKLVSFGHSNSAWNSPFFFLTVRMIATTSAEATLATSHTKPKDKNEAALIVRHPSARYNCACGRRNINILPNLQCSPSLPKRVRKKVRFTSFFWILGMIE